MDNFSPARTLSLMETNQHPESEHGSAQAPEHDALPESPRALGPEFEYEELPSRELEASPARVLEHRDEPRGVEWVLDAAGREQMRISRGRELAGSAVSALSVLVGLVAGIFLGGMALESVGSGLVASMGGSGPLALAKSGAVALVLSIVILVMGVFGAVVGGFVGEGITWRGKLRERL